MMEYYIALAFGIGVYILLQLNGVLNLPEFKWTFFFRTNIIPTALNVLLGCALIFMRADLTGFYPITLFSSFMLGVSGQAILKKLTVMFDKNVDTKFGLNKSE
jgi:hypothetical protein